MTRKRNISACRPFCFLYNHVPKSLKIFKYCHPNDGPDMINLLSYYMLNSFVKEGKDVSYERHKFVDMYNNWSPPANTLISLLKPYVVVKIFYHNGFPTSNDKQELVEHVLRIYDRVDALFTGDYITMRVNGGTNDHAETNGETVTTTGLGQGVPSNCSKCGHQRSFMGYEMVCTECGHVGEDAIEFQAGTSHDLSLRTKQFHGMYSSSTAHCCVEYKSRQGGYDPKNNWRDIINRKQARESVKFEPAHILKIKHHLNVCKIQNKHVTPRLLRRVLRKLDLKQYLNNVDTLEYEFTGTPPKVFTSDEIRQLCYMYECFVNVYPKVKSKKRKSLINNVVIGYKLCELLGLDDKCAMFPLLKDAEKLREQLDVWNKACVILGWRVIDTSV